MLGTLIAAAADSWRSALLVLVASAALAATRIRFAGYAALCLLAIAAVVALSGRAGTRDDRHERDSVSAQGEDRRSTGASRRREDARGGAHRGRQ